MSQSGSVTNRLVAALNRVAGWVSWGAAILMFSMAGLWWYAATEASVARVATPDLMDDIIFYRVMIAMLALAAVAVACWLTTAYLRLLGKPRQYSLGLASPIETTAASLGGVLPRIDETAP